ncbi:LOW QUALITY PROTEIN: golgin subfamily A member 6-like protein 22 [Drosophila busckii]|uniref:LOW QUALITY PROTEIN: golgin subfamily A member 6-like protein 22 n=1 Tax=Drosophila busckii TaxID=30019 RepID=UPI001432B133|nr:LOW QUALITY PROTEIN: golgin subfamily A member 6-like protein 22 [Drosophila busckii]
MWRILIKRSLCSKRKKPVLSSKPSNTPHPPKDPPEEAMRQRLLEHKGFEVPSFVSAAAFRQFDSPGEQLGPCAGKNMIYKNAQYFGYHRYSFATLLTQSVELRNERRENGGVQPESDVDDEEEDGDDCLEVMQQLEQECEKLLKEQADTDKKEKVKEWATALQKRMENLSEQETNMSDEEMLVWCEQMEKKQQKANKQQPKPNQDPVTKAEKHKVDSKEDSVSKKRQHEQKVIKGIIDSKVTEILSECVKKGLEQDKKDALILSECVKKSIEQLQKEEDAKQKDEPQCDGKDEPEKK